VKYNFYRRDIPGVGNDEPPRLPSEYRLVTWVPRLGCIAPSCLRGTLDKQKLLRGRHLWFFWLHYHLLHLVAEVEYKIALVYRNEQLMHFSIIRSKDYRFPFMQRHDLQIGPVWTDSAARGKGIATAVAVQLTKEAKPSWSRVWWICEISNVTSNQVAKRLRLELFGQGVRLNRLGVRSLGCFAMATPSEGSAIVPEFTNITETPGLGATSDQLSILFTRYHLAIELVKDKDVLEVACGAGLGLGYLAQRAARVVGGDIDEENLRTARETHKHHRGIIIDKIDAQSLPYPACSFDVIILFEALYYLASADSFVREASRVLRSEGTLLISSVNRQWTGFNPSPYSVKYYDHSELASLLSSGGFDSVTYAGFPEVKPGVVAASVKRIRRVAVKLRLVPKTMKQKQWLKRLFYGKLAPIPREVTETTGRLEPLVPISDQDDTTSYRMIYAISRKREERDL
jgi:2-polyprenyl-3-methyl-5-hydroxy-6-metoxy-1,4-benzoquinol methylase